MCFECGDVEVVDGLDPVFPLQFYLQEDKGSVVDDGPKLSDKKQDTKNTIRA